MKSRRKASERSGDGVANLVNRHVLVVVLAALAAGVSAFVAVLLLDQRSGSTIVIQDPIAETEIVVWVGGAVEKPGVYTLPAGARLNDAIEVAGGFAARADTSTLNLAERLDDEARIEIPHTIQSVEKQTNGSPVPLPVTSANAPSPTDNRIDINTADSVALESLPGIGPVLAARIIEYRTQNGPFQRIEELDNVTGISSKLVDTLGDLITVGS